MAEFPHTGRDAMLNERTIIGLEEACAYDAPALYGITDADTGHVVYIGRTKNLSNRMKKYTNPKRCHNGGLKGWIMKKGGLFTVSMFRFGDDLYKAERKAIAEMKDQLFNLVGGGVGPWHDHDSLPWMCGAGIRCPSDIAIWHLLRADKTNHQEIADSARKMRSEMTIEDRCRYEVRVAMDLPRGFADKLEKWRARVEYKMVASLESSARRESLEQVICQR